MVSFAAQVRAILRRSATDTGITYEEIARQLDLVSRDKKQPLYGTLRDFIRRGECERISEGLVRYVPHNRPKAPPKTACMWRLIRANRNGTITVEDLMALCTVAEATAREYLRLLTKHGIVRRIDRPGNQLSKYQLINDPGPEPVRNDVNAAKLRRLRAARKKALKQIQVAQGAIDDVNAALDKARCAVANMGDDRNT